MRVMCCFSCAFSSPSYGHMLTAIEFLHRLLWYSKANSHLRIDLFSIKCLSHTPHHTTPSCVPPQQVLAIGSEDKGGRRRDVIWDGMRGWQPRSCCHHSAEHIPWSFEITTANTCSQFSAFKQSLAEPLRIMLRVLLLQAKCQSMMLCGCLRTHVHMLQEVYDA